MLRHHGTSVLAHEILTAKPYAFLDDGEAVDRRTNAVPLRRGLPVRPAELGSLDPAAVDQVREEITPNPITADELHDLLSLLVITSAQPAWQGLFDQLVERGRAVALGDQPTGIRWHTAEAATAVAVLRTDTPSAELFPETVTADVVRGHLELLSPVTAAELAEVTGIRHTRIDGALAALEAEGFAIQGRFLDTGADTPQWCSRRLLARMHAYSRRKRRRAIEPVSPLDFVRFTARWQHVAPGAQVHGIGGLRTILEQLQGHPAPAAAWESEILSARMRTYQPTWLDRLCHDGEIMWLRLQPRVMADPDKRGAGPSKATPISLVFRTDLAWLLQAARGLAEAPEPTVGAVAEIAAALRANGARFAAELAQDCGRLGSDIEAAVWDGVARGLLTGDGFEAIRELLDGPRRAPRPTPRLSRLRKAAPAPCAGAGRWSLVPDVAPVTDREELAEAMADQLLQRWGVIFYDLAAHEGLALPWRDMQWALRRLEDRGLVRGGRFVAGFSGEQFALPEAVEALKVIRKTPNDGRTITLSAADPLNLTGVILPGPRTPALRTNTIDLPV